MNPITILPPYNGISQDLTYGDTGECTYMQNISNDEMGYESLDRTYIVNHDLGITDTITHMVETPAGVISCGNSRVFLNGGDKSGLIAGARRVEYVLDSTGTQFNYFINNVNIRKTDASITTVIDTDIHAGGTVTASCVVYNTILFAIGSTIYKYDIGAGGTISTAASTLQTGLTVKNLYFYNDMLVATCVKGNDTITYQLQFDGTNYDIYSTELKQGYACVGAIGDGGIVYWLTSNKILGFSGGTSQEIRFIGNSSSFTEATFGSSPSIAMDKGVIIIGNGTTIYRFGTRYSGRRRALTIKTIVSTIQQLTANYVHTQTTTNYIYGNSTKYPDSGFSITSPYRASAFGVEKSGLKLRVGYELPTGCTITISVNTEKTGTSFVDVAIISDTTKYEQTIDISEITSALATAGYNPDFYQLRIKRTLNGGGGTSGLRDNTPKIYDILLIHNTINYDI